MNGSIREEDIEEVQERNNIVEVIAEYVTLKKSGRSFKALCPFHKEKTPSFMVDPIKQLFHCFGCDEGGNVINFIMKIENTDFPEAVKTLADRVGYRLDFEKADTRQYSRQNRLYEINNQAMLAFQRYLLDGEKGVKAREYLKTRGYNADTAKTFRLGLAPPNWDDLLKYLSRKGFNVDEIIDAGLVIKGEKGKVYDRFRSRIIFPIFDLRGRVVGFGGRVFGASDRKDAPKYMNSPETPVYHKSSILYWLNEAKSEIAKQSQVLVVEGYTDVISLHQAGIKNAAATCGTAFTSEHLKTLSRFAGQIILVFDADAAGKAAAERGLDLLSERKVDISVLSLPVGLDPAEFITKKGKEDFIELINEAVPLTDFCLDQVLAKYDIGLSTGKVKAGEEAMLIIARLPSQVAQEEYLRKLSDRLGASLSSVHFEFNKLIKPKKRRNQAIESEQERSSALKLDPQAKAELEIIKFIAHCPEYAENVFSELDGPYFSERGHRNLFEKLKKGYQESKSQLDVAGLLNVADDDKERNLISKVMLDFVIPEEKESYFEDILSKLKEFEIQRQINTLRLKLESLDPMDNPANYDELFEALIGLEASKRDLQPKR